MIKRYAIFWSIFVLQISCTNQREISHNNTHDLPACGGNYDSKYYETDKKYQAVSTIVIHSIIKESDTIYIQELLCTDSIKFTQAFKGLNVSQLCAEYGFQGNTYYGVVINNLGFFENFERLRTLDACFDSFDDQVELKLGQMKTISEEYFNTRLIFYHRFSLI